MATGFLMVYACQTWNLPDLLAGGFIIAMQVGQADLEPAFGFLADRKGHKLSLEITFLFSILSIAIARVGSERPGFMLFSYFRGAVMSRQLCLRNLNRL